MPVCFVAYLKKTQSKPPKGQRPSRDIFAPEPRGTPIFAMLPRTRAARKLRRAPAASTSGPKMRRGQQLLQTTILLGYQETSDGMPDLVWSDNKPPTRNEDDVP